MFVISNILKWAFKYSIIRKDMFTNDYYLAIDEVSQAQIRVTS